MGSSRLYTAHADANSRPADADPPAVADCSGYNAGPAAAAQYVCSHGDKPAGSDGPADGHRKAADLHAGWEPNGPSGRYYTFTNALSGRSPAFLRNRSGKNDGNAIDYRYVG